MSAEENKALVRRFVDEVQSQGNIDALDEICSPEFVNHSAPPRVPTNCEGVKQLTAMFRQAFPDSYFTVEDILVYGGQPRHDAAAWHRPSAGRHGGSQPDLVAYSPKRLEGSFSEVRILDRTGAYSRPRIFMHHHN